MIQVLWFSLFGQGNALTWNYLLMQYRDEHPEFAHRFGIHEVYYADDGTVTGWTEDAIKYRQMVRSLVSSALAISGTVSPWSRSSLARRGVASVVPLARPHINALLAGDGDACGLPLPAELQFDFGKAEHDGGDHATDRAAQVDLLRHPDDPLPTSHRLISASWESVFWWRLLTRT